MIETERWSNIGWADESSTWRRRGVCRSRKVLKSVVPQGARYGVRLRMAQSRAFLLRI